MEFDVENWLKGTQEDIMSVMEAVMEGASVIKLGWLEEVVVMGNSNDSGLDVHQTLVHLHLNIYRLTNGTINYNYILPSQDAVNYISVIPELNKMDGSKNLLSRMVVEDGKKRNIVQTTGREEDEKGDAAKNKITIEETGNT